MEIYLKSGNGFFVPSIVADHLLGIASHDQLKVLLYVLAHPDTALTPEAIASACKVRPENTEEALAFWQDANVLTVSRNVPSVTLTDAVQPAAQPVQTVPAELPPAKPEPTNNTESRKKAKESPRDSSDYIRNPTEISERIKNDPEMSEMIQEVEKILGSIPHQQTQSLLWMHDTLGLPPAVILMLCSYCKSINKMNIRYCERIAVNWSDRNVNNCLLAEQEISRMIETRQYIGQLKTCFGIQIGMDPTEKQQEYFEAWQQAGISTNMVIFACERCRDSNNNKISFAYIDKILKSWTQKGITTVEAAKLEGAQFAAARKAGRQDAPSVPFDTKKQPADVRIDGEPSLDLSEIDSIFNQF